MKVKRMLDMKNVQRMSGKFKLMSYNLQEHGFMVANLFMKLAKEEGIEITVEDVDFVLNHDALESITGDLTWEVKNYSKETKRSWGLIEREMLNLHPDLKGYSDFDVPKGVVHDLFKVCDYLDLYLFVHQEFMVGNHTPEIIEIKENCFKLIHGKFNSVDKILEEYS